MDWYFALGPTIGFVFFLGGTVALFLTVRDRRRSGRTD
jgi:hypothetical protein